MEALVNYRIYLSAAPSEKDAAAVGEKVVELQYLQERAQKQRSAKAALVGNLSGVWQNEDARYEATSNGDVISMVKIAYWNIPDRRWVPVEGEPPRYGPTVRARFEGRVQGLSISGTTEVDYRPQWRNGQVFTRPMGGAIDPNGKRIRLDFGDVFITRARGAMVEGWGERTATLVLERQ